MKKTILFIALITMGYLVKAQKITGTYGETLNREKSLLWTTNYDPSVFTHMETSFSSDSKYYAYGSNEGKVFIRDVATGEIVNSYLHHDKQVLSILFQPNGSIIASSDKNGVLVFYDYVTKIIKCKKDAHEEKISSMCFSVDGTKLFTGSSDKTVKAWDVATCNLIYEIKTFSNGITCVKTTLDGKKLIVSTNAITKAGLHILDITTGQELSKINVMNVERFEVSPDGRYIATSNIERKVNIWDANTGTLETSIKKHTAYTSCLAWNPKGGYLVSAAKDKKLFVWNDYSQRLLVGIENNNNYENVVFSPKGDFLATLNLNGTIAIYNAKELISPDEPAKVEPTVNYSEAAATTTLPKPEIVIAPSDILVDIDGNKYETIQVGPRVWMAENLRVSKYSNGDRIPYVYLGEDWLKRTTGACTHYNNTPNKDTLIVYGKIYNWYTVIDSRNVCPTGWHVPSKLEWSILTLSLGGEMEAGGKMKNLEFWRKPNTGATNESGFSALGGGIRDINGNFDLIDIAGVWWLEDQESETHGRTGMLLYDDKAAKSGSGPKGIGASIRCVKD